MSETQTTETTTSKSPTHIAYHVRDGRDKGFFTRIGVAWPHKDGKGFNVQLDIVPLDGKITLRTASEKEGLIINRAGLAPARRERILTMPAFIISKSLFPLGQIVITSNALSKLSQPDMLDGLQRHAAGDWGALPGEDAQQNDEALHGGGRIFSAYGEGAQRYWIITEADRSVTTILMPEDY